MCLSPLFIVGSPRSGTSVLTSGLLAAGYSGFREGNFLSLIRAVERVIDQHARSFYTDNPQVLTSRIDHAALKEGTFAAIAHEAARHQPTQPWLDKTGGHEMIESIPMLRRIYPGSRFLFAHRRAIENIVSRIVKFPNHTFEYHCMDWSRTMGAWRRLRDTYSKCDFLEIDQQDIAQAPDDVARKIGAFLELLPSSIDRLAKTFAQERPQQTRKGSAESVLSMMETKWSPEQIAIFDKHCGYNMKAFGYSLDKSYRKPAAPHRPVV